MGFARVREGQSADAELAKSGITPLHGKGGNLDHKVIKHDNKEKRLVIAKRIPIYTTIGRVIAQPGELLIWDERGCWVVVPK